MLLWWAFAPQINRRVTVGERMPSPPWTNSIVAFGMVLLASAPAIVALFALPIAWTAVASLSFCADVAPWLDTRLALGPMSQQVMSATQWAHAGTALALWMLLALLIGARRITRRAVAA